MQLGSTVRPGRIKPALVHAVAQSRPAHPSTRQRWGDEVMSVTWECGNINNNADVTEGSHEQITCTSCKRRTAPDRALRTEIHGRTEEEIEEIIEYMELMFPVLTWQKDVLRKVLSGRPLRLI